jgi:hypothetical protein
MEERMHTIWNEDNLRASAKYCLSNQWSKTKLIIIFKNKKKKKKKRGKKEEVEVEEEAEK